MSAVAPRLVLGSSSPRRVDMLAQIGITPDIIQAPDIDESAKPREIPSAYCVRIAMEKCAALADQFPNDFIITADTTGAVGRRILGKPEDRADAEKMIRLLSGRAHIIYTAVVVKAPGKAPVARLSENRVKVKRLSDPELQSFLDTKEWEGCAGGYKLQQYFAQYIMSISGSPSGIVGLPLYETMQLLNGLGYKIDTGLGK
jgi:septum formation protein